MYYFFIQEVSLNNLVSIRNFLGVQGRSHYPRGNNVFNDFSLSLLSFQKLS